MKNKMIDETTGEFDIDNIVINDVAVEAKLSKLKTRIINAVNEVIPSETTTEEMKVAFLTMLLKDTLCDTSKTLEYTVRFKKEKHGIVIYYSTIHALDNYHCRLTL